MSADYNIGLANTTSISTHASGGSADVSQNLIFSPTVTDLSVAPGATFGDSALLKVRLKGLLPSPYDYQLYGCSVPVNNCLMNGWLRAEVHCDTNLRIAGPATHAQLVYYRITQGDTLVLKPDYVFAAVDTNLCEAGNYNYYFNMNSAGFKAFLDSAHFEFTVQACCRIDKGATPYQINFYTLPNPSNCLTLTQTTPNTLPVISDVRQQWLPLSYTGDQISVHCPGCLAPGAIVSNYKINRVSFGLQDSNNDSRTDNATKIIKGDNYYNTFKNYLNENFAHYSDTLEDYLSAYFQDGDNSGTGGGYTYQQLVTAGVPLHFMQLSRIIPFGLDSFNLTIDSVVLYIDTLIPNTNACIDCADFGLTGNSVVTQSVVAFNRADAYSHCVLADVPRNQLLFTFCDTTGGNIQAFETFTNNSFPFVAFKTGQRYRLKVRYSVCGNYRLPFNSISNLVCNSPISNNLWFTGKQQGADAIATLPQMPNTVGAMETDFHYSFNASSGYPLPNQNFIDSARFYCETFGGRFYFAPTSYYNNSTVTNSQGCEKRITAVYIADLAGYRNRIFDVYPYEYRVPPLFADTISFQIPNGYYISLMRVRSGVYYDNNGQLMAPFSAYDTLTPPQLTGLVQIPFDALPVMHCLQQSMSPAGNDTAAFAGDQFTRLELQCFIRRFDCSNTIDTLPLSSVYSSTGLFESECNPTENLSCTPLATAADSIPFNANIQPLLVQPNLNLVLPVSNVANAQQQQLCWTVKVLNPKVVVQPGTPDIYSTGADNVFLGVPLNGAIPALQNWQFTPTGQSTINAVNGIIPLTAHLAAGDSVTGQLCATFVSCDSTINSFPLYYGWNCNDFPTATSQIPDTICGADYVTLGIEYFQAAITGEGKGYIPNNYTLCDTLKKFTCIFNSNPGYAYPDFAGLINIPQGLNILSAYILNPNATPVTVSYLTGSAPSWQITPANMQALGFANGGIHLTDRFCVYFNLIPECAFASDTTLPDILVAGKNYCGDSLSYTAYFNYNNQSPLFMDSTACTDCWSITKTAGTDTTNVGDTLTYTITVCNNSVNTQTGILADNTPANFVITNSTLPATVTLNSMQCATFTVSGYFTSPGSCFYNVASITSPANTVWKDSVCVTVLNVCANTDTTFADSTYSGKKVYNNISIFIAGKYYVSDSLVLNNCMVYANAGSQIIVLANSTLVLNNTSIQSCDTMWQGILVNNEGRIYLLNNSTLKDADVGITTNKGSVAIIDSASIVDCVRGIYAPPATGFVNTSITVSRTEIAMKSIIFKPDYIGQPAHGNLPYTGIEVNNIIMTLGGIAGKLNEFYKLNNGFVAHNSIINIKRTKFYNITKDVSYTNQYQGMAMATDASTTSLAMIRVLPEATTYNTVDNAEYGIYARGVTVAVDYLHLLNVRYGVYCIQTPAAKTSTVTNCTITSRHIGIFFVSNPLAKFMIANNNTITISGTVNSGFSLGHYGIWMSEANPNASVRYYCNGNTINLYNAQHGIYSGVLNTAKIKFNNIKINNNGNNSGITIWANRYSSISCNSISGIYSSGLNASSKGILMGNNSLLGSNSLYCNSVDSTHRGIYFGGVNPSTYLKATEFHHHYNGLYINNSGSIGWQTHFGNRWNNTNLSYQAFSGNSQAPAFSRFIVDSTLSSDYWPLNNISGWFNPSSGNTFYCSNSSVCNTPPPALTATEVEELIANGTFETEEFAEESRAIAEEYLYALLSNDSTLLLEDSAFVAFMSENEDAAVGYLYDTEEYMRAAYSFDTVYINLLDSANNQIDILNDSIVWLEENQPPNWEALKEQFINTINFLTQTIQNINMQRDALMNDNFTQAELVNEIVVPENLPQENTQIINEREMQFMEEGTLIITNNYEELFAIASQCPYAGGPAVERARTLIALVNDSVYYDDDNVCLQSGIYRQSNNNSNNIKQEIKVININPNPANDEVTITLIGKFEGLCTIEITNALGVIIVTKTLNCKDAVAKIDVSKLTPGAYTIKVNAENKYSVHSKLVIIR